MNSTELVTIMGVVTALGAMPVMAWLISKLYRQKPRQTALLLFWAFNFMLSGLLCLGWWSAYLGHPPAGTWFRLAGVYMLLALTFLATMDTIRLKR